MAKYKLGEICEIVSGSTPKTGIDEYWDGDIKWITPADYEYGEENCISEIEWENRSCWFGDGFLLVKPYFQQL